jgi:type IV secretory pathway VirB4 component
MFKKKEEKSLKGVITLGEKISPAYINNKNPKYIEIDNIYYGGLLVIDYPRENTDLILNNLLNTNINMNIPMFYEKQNPYKVIRDLTYNIGNVGVDIKDSSNQNRQDIDIAAFTYNDARYIRKEIQVNNEEIYFLYIYLNIFSEDANELEYLLNKIEGIMHGSGMKTIRANFRQEQVYKACLPIFENSNDIKNVSKRNVLSSRNACYIPVYYLFNIR